MFDSIRNKLSFDEKNETTTEEMQDMVVSSENARLEVSEPNGSAISEAPEELAKEPTTNENGVVELGSYDRDTQVAELEEDTIDVSVAAARKSSLLTDSEVEEIEKHRSLHNGLNRIVRVENKEAYKLLNSLPETHTNVTEGDSEDIEILTNGSIMLPPSEVDHSKDCSSSKPCNGKGGIDGYDLLSVNPEAPSLQVEAVEQICDILNVNPEREKEPDYTEGEVSNVPSPTPCFNIEKEFNDNVPSIEHSFSDRLEYMKFGDWKGQDHFLELYNGNFSNVSGSNKQGKAEMKLANYIGFFFGNNENIVRLLMDNVPFDSHYSKYDKHRKTLLEYATSVDWCYCEEVKLETKLVVATELWINETISKEELIESSGLSERQVRNVIDILEAENAIEKEYKNRERIYNNKGITESYIERLDNIAEERDSNNNTIEKTSSNVSRVSI